METRQDFSKQFRSAPNIVTMGRILAVPVVVVLLFFPGKTPSFFAAFIFFWACVTDYLDGYLARRKGVTDLGKFLDPLADKLLVNATMIMLIPLERIPAWMVVVIISREMAVTGLRGIASADGEVFSASILAKYKTTFQMFAIGFLLLHYEYFNVNMQAVGYFFFVIAVVITIVSGVDYFWKFFTQKPMGE